MPALPAPAAAVQAADRSPLATALHLLDEQLGVLGAALAGHDAHALQAAADQFVAALDTATPVLREPGALTPALRRQLAYSAGRVAAQREALARATAAVDRAIEVLLPAPAAKAGTYTASGYAARPAASGSAWA